MTCHLTVAIPTYNGAKRLPLVLESLMVQKHLSHICWEVLVVDNNSTDETSTVVQNFKSVWQQRFSNQNPPDQISDERVPLRYLKEQRQGAAYARQRAIATAHGKWVAFLDDDNIPSNNWLFQAYQFAEQGEHSRGQLGAFSGQIHGVFPNDISPELKRYIRPYLAIVERGDRPFQYDLAYKVLPPSAGLVVRREAWLESVPDTLILGGRTSDSMLTSEDLETLVYFQQKGWEIWYNPAMHMDHLIPPWRLKRDYLIPFLKGIGLTRHVIRMLRVPPLKRPLWTLLYGLNDARRLLMHWFTHQNRLGHDLVADCKLVFLYSSLISPWFMFHHQRSKKLVCSRKSSMLDPNKMSMTVAKSHLD